MQDLNNKNYKTLLRIIKGDLSKCKIFHIHGYENAVRFIFAGVPGWLNQLGIQPLI